MAFLGPRVLNSLHTPQGDPGSGSGHKGPEAIPRDTLRQGQGGVLRALTLAASAVVHALLLSCGPARAPDIPKLTPERQELVARLSLPPREARFTADSAVILLDGSGNTAQFRRFGGTWRAEDLSSGRFGSIPASAGATLVVSPDGLMLWDPVSTVLRPLLSPSSEPVEVPLQRPDEVFVSGTQGGMPRHHGRLLVSGTDMVLERRVFRPQADSITTPGYLVHSDSGFQKEDTLHSFVASTYGQRTGGVMVCCSRPLVFSPQAHWVLAGKDLVAFSSGDGSSLLLIPLEDGLGVDSIPWGLTQVG